MDTVAYLRTYCMGRYWAVEGPAHASTKGAPLVTASHHDLQAYLPRLPVCMQARGGPGFCGPYGVNKRHTEARGKAVAAQGCSHRLFPCFRYGEKRVLACSLSAASTQYSVIGVLTASSTGRRHLHDYTLSCSCPTMHWHSPPRQPQSPPRQHPSKPAAALPHASLSHSSSTAPRR